jgi:hypothetical protein
LPGILPEKQKKDSEQVGMTEKNQAKNDIVFAILR